MTPNAATPLDLPLAGPATSLIEASAGTGKTYALTTLAARLIVEARREIGDFLVVTFTVAATDELRQRIRSTLRAALRAAAGAASDGGQAGDLLARWASLGIDAAEARRRLEPAVADLDRANVLTIHGFCQRVIKDFAFDCGLPFGFEVSGDGFDVVSAEVRDHWRRAMYPAPRMRMQFARAQRFLPELLTDWVIGHLGKPALDIRGAARLDAVAALRVEERETLWERALGAARGEATAAGDGGRRLAAVATALQHPLGIALHPREAFAGCLDRAYEGSGLGRSLAALDDASHALREAYEGWLPRARRAALEDVRERVSRRIREERRLGYDDLLLTVHEALTRVPGLAARIRKRYPIALIDEYQDTDRAQAEIFQRIYGDAGSMVIVGDPKQSIYRFRSADIFAYLSASAALDEGSRLTLARNHRAVPRLVAAVNAVFAGEQPFGLPEIAFTPALAALAEDAPGLLVAGAERTPPLTLRLMATQAAKHLTKNAAKVLAANDAADEIARLLALAKEGGASIGGRPVSGSDIAVLVRKVDQGRRMVAALAERGVRSVEVGVDDVFDSREALELERLLWAVASPHSAARMRGALAGDLFGMDATQLARLVDDDDAWNDWKERLAAWRQAWQVGGVAAMLRRLLRNFDATAAPPGAAPDGAARQLLRHGDGLRRLTNVMHLADLLQQAEAAGHLTPTGVAAWLSRRRARPNPNDEVAQLRLESDEDLVKILTVHRSKGLEFPIVFLPFAWDGPARPRSKGDARFHDRDVAGSPEVLHLAPTPAERHKERLEEFSEEVRLLYVGLTRARLRCVATWGRVSGSEAAPLTWLLRKAGRGAAAAGSALEDPIDALERVRNGARKMPPEAWLARVEGLVARCPDAIGTALVPAEAPAPRRPAQPPPAQPLTARALARPLRRIRQLTSYSALAGPAGVAGPGPDDAERDLDASIETVDAVPEGAAPERSPFTFPAGARVGACLHEVFESLARGAKLDDVLGDALSRHRIDAAWQEVAQRMVENVWNAPLEAIAGPGSGRPWRISELRRPLPEMEFHLPARGLERAGLARALDAHGYGPLSAAGGEAVVDGYLRGFVDLVAERHGAWYVIDYKTNLLGTRAADYARPRLEAAMRRHGYPLQYLLYVLALHRLLRCRLPGYGYETHMGGVFYLFTRGIEGAGGEPGQGIHFHRPSAPCIDALDACFAGAAP